MSDFHVGILALDVYFPSTYVSQEDLEVQNNCKGKYTVGLGQDSMAFCGDREDINSISLTVVNSLLTKYKIPKSMIGRIEIGTESLIDKSKSTKTVIMDLFAESGNTDIEGVTVVNACYGGTAALLNTLCWVDSSSWDGRYGLVIAADIAVYSDGPARPTGGCGAVAMLIGRNAPLPVNLRTRTCYSTHVWDFFKPKMSSEYPEVNGALSQTCYLKALDDCYTRFLAKQTKLDTAADKLAYGLSTIDEFLFHSPYNKLVQKSFNRLVYLDMIAGRLPNDAVEKWRHVPIESTYEDKELESKMKDTAGPLYAAKVADGCTLSKQIGNTYTASLYMNLSCIVSLKGASLLGKRLTLFSYGSGAMASMFEINPRETYSEFTLQRIQEALSVTARLADRQKMTPEDLTRALEIREHSHGLAPYHPYCTTEGLYPGTYYLEEINSLYERLYRVKSIESLRVPGPMVDPVKVTNGAKTAVTAEKKNIKGPPPLAVGGNSTDYLPSQALDALIEGAEENGDDTNTDYSGGISIDHNDGWRSVEGDNPNPSSDIRRRFSAKGMPRVQTMVWASGKLNVKVVVTGVAAALPGRDKPLVIESGSKNIQRVIQGENFITPIPDHVKDAMLEKNVVEMIKNKDGVLEKRSISTHQDNINLCAAIGTFNLNDYGVSDSIASTMDKSVQVSIIAGLEALKHSGLVSGVGPKGWELPESMQNTTGVVFATSFPALDTAIAEVSRYYTSKQLHSQNLPVVIALLREKLRGQLDGGVLSSEVESAVKLLEEEIIRLGALQSDGTEKVKPYEFDRKFLFRVLVLGNAQLAQIIKVRINLLVSFQYNQYNLLHDDIILL